MPKVRNALIIGVGMLAAAAAGCAVGLMLAPASGAELRRQLGRRATRRVGTVSASLEHALDRVADRAKRQIEEKKRQVAEALGG